MKNLGQMWRWLPWVSEVFLAKFPLSVMSVLWPALSVAPASFGRRIRPPAARKKKPLVPRVGGERYPFCDFGRIIRPDTVVQMRDNSWRRTVCFCTSWTTNWGLYSFDSSFCRSIIPLRLCDGNWSQLAFLEGFYMIKSLKPRIIRESNPLESQSCQFCVLDISEPSGAPKFIDSSNV